MYMDRESIGIKSNPLPDRLWSIKKLTRFMELPKIEELLAHNTDYDYRDLIFEEHNYSSDSDSG